jgi:hypothetical protein
VLIYSRTLTDAELATVETALGATGGQVFYDGNSMTDPLYSSYPASTTALLEAAGHPVHHLNVGVSGQRIDQMITDAAATLDAICVPTLPFSVLVYWEGRNALDVAAANVDQVAHRSAVLADMLTYGRARIAAGFTVVCLPVPPTAAATNVTYEADRVWLNAELEAAAAAANPHCHLQMEAADYPTLFAPGANANATHYADSVHMVTGSPGVGYELLATYVAAAVGGLL